jgi:phage terminase large subunit GpA-like protein
LLDAIDSAEWNRFCVTGPTQTGKTLVAFVIPILYHLFEVGETVIVGIPDLDMSGDKYREDILPVIERSRYRDLLPTSGAGSKGGRVKSIKFRNGATLRFMSGGGGDKARAGFTSRVLVVTETDGMDEAGGTSREADKIAQLEGRTRAHGNRKRIYLECTVSIATGRTWREYTAGTASKLYPQCPHCRQFVLIERQHLVGWQSAESDVEAEEETQFYCPACAETWTEADRLAANLAAKLVHRGQSITPAGEISGEPARTKTLGFRWPAGENLFLTAGDIAIDEWRAARATDEDNAEKEMRQFVWALPYEPPTLDDTPLDPSAIQKRMGRQPKGEVPDDAEWVTIGVDLGKYKGWWLAVAWRPKAIGHVFDYGQFTIETPKYGVQRALRGALRNLWRQVTTGWVQSQGGRRVPDQVWIDANYETDTVMAFCRETHFRARPILGRGSSMFKMGPYQRPEKTTATVVQLGEQYHVDRLPERKVYRPVINADYWKTWLHQRLTTPVRDDAGGEVPGALTLYAAGPDDHAFLAKQLAAERPLQKWDDRRGWVETWEKVYKQNHWLDCGYIASAAGHFCGVRLDPSAAVAKPVPAVRTKPILRMPDGRPFLVTER